MMNVNESYSIYAVFIALFLFPYNVAASKPCYGTLDIVQVQDVTSSFHPFWPNLTAKVGSIMQMLKKDPDVHFGFATFGDKNISGTNQKTKKRHTLGSKTDYCLRVDEPLRKPDATKMVKLFKQYQSRDAGGQGDSPVNVFEAIYRAIIASKLRWRKPLGNEKAARFIFVVTGASSHIQGDVLELTSKTVREFAITPSDIRRNGDNENHDCDKVDYPTLQQMAELIEDFEAVVVLLIAPGGTSDSKGNFKLYKSVVALGKGYQAPVGLSWWYSEQLSAFRKHFIWGPLDPEMSEYSEAFQRTLRDFDKVRCKAD